MTQREEFEAWLTSQHKAGSVQLSKDNDGDYINVYTIHQWKAWQAAQAAQPAQMPGWLPIESALKDGTAIRLANKWGEWIGKYLPVYGSGFPNDKPWTSLMLNHDHMGEKWHPPTHWQPLAAAPSTKEKAE